MTKDQTTAEGTPSPEADAPEESLATAAEPDTPAAEDTFAEEAGSAEAALHDSDSRSEEAEADSEEVPEAVTEAQEATLDAADDEPAPLEDLAASGEADRTDAPPGGSSTTPPVVLSEADLDRLDEGEYSPDEYDEMMALYEDTLSEIAEGEIVKASVLRKTDSAVILDVGFKSEGSVPLDEFRDPEALEAGDEVEVFLESLEDQEGVVVLSKKKADFLRVWEKIKEAFDSDQTVPGILKRKIKGGVTVDLMGVDAFLPGSQIALRRVPNVDELIGQTFDFKILKLNKRRRNIVVSRRVILEDERAGKREDLKQELEVGQVRTGIVKNITDFGAFIDLGGMDGLLHITDMSWGRIGHPSELCQIGDELDVKILDIDWERERISLGLKQLLAFPWEDVARKYPVGSRVRGRVVSITNYGAFIELEKGVEGLVHISEMSWTRNIRHPSQLVSISDEIECVILRVDEEEKKISLGMKQTEEDPWLALPAKYPSGTKIRGVVRNLTSFGAFVEVEPGIDGLVHISDMSWTRRVQHPSEVVKKGEEVEVVALNIDPDQKRISLGLKQIEDDPWYELAQKYEPATECEGHVVRLLDKGIVVDLGDDVEGFVPVSQLGIEEEVADPAECFVEGDRLELKVLESDPINRRIVLLVTAAPGVEDRIAAEAAAAEAAPEADAEGAAPEELAVEEATDAAEEIEPAAEAEPIGEAELAEAEPVADVDAEVVDEAVEPAAEEEPEKLEASAEEEAEPEVEDAGAEAEPEVEDVGSEAEAEEEIEAEAAEESPEASAGEEPEATAGEEAEGAEEGEKS
jgi:small subunit ribosomal protein S1